MNSSVSNSLHNVIAIIPAAGKATRLPGIKQSKEIIPIGYKNTSTQRSVMDKPICFHLLEKLSLAGVNQGIMIIREGKWDIPKTLGSGACVNMDIAYQILRLPFGTAYTIDQAYPFSKDKIVVIGFPDILFTPDDAYTQILDRLAQNDADVVLGLFPADRPQKTDMVNVNSQQIVSNIIVKPQKTHLKLTWGIAAWKPVFTEFLHTTLMSRPHKDSDTELFIGNAIQNAIESGLNVIGIQISDAPFIDIGTPDDLERAMNIFQK